MTATISILISVPTIRDRTAVEISLKGMDIGLAPNFIAICSPSFVTGTNIQNNVLMGYAIAKPTRISLRFKVPVEI